MPSPDCPSKGDVSSDLDRLLRLLLKVNGDARALDPAGIAGALPSRSPAPRRLPWTTGGDCGDAEALTWAVMPSCDVHACRTRDSRPALLIALLRRRGPRASTVGPIRAR